MQHLIQEKINNMTDDDLEYELFEFILENKIADNYKNEYKDVTHLPKGLKFHYATWQLECQVYNGGFNQYFYNTAGNLINEAIEGYKYFGLNEIAKIVEEAARVAIDEIDLHIKTKMAGTLEAFSDSYKYSNLGEIDDKFYEISGCISEVRINFIRNNIDDFTYI